MTPTTDEIISRIRSRGYGVSVHHMREYVETHAVLLAKPDEYYPSRAASFDGNAFKARGTGAART
jgi:hypothetical protein